jgi:hypothetical protein
MVSLIPHKNPDSNYGDRCINPQTPLPDSRHSAPLPPYALPVNPVSYTDRRCHCWQLFDIVDPEVRAASLEESTPPELHQLTLAKPLNSHDSCFFAPGRHQQTPKGPENRVPEGEDHIFKG